jgi:hypothetical protein
MHIFSEVSKLASERTKLVRSHFEATRDLTWVEVLEPKCKQEKLDESQTEARREAWNRHTEAADWAWWQEQATESNEKLGQDIKEMTERKERIIEYREMLAEARFVGCDDNGIKLKP